ncbi:MAG: hypothetical protein QOK48_2946, partial [Blastocatellia bacterium]|jgi:hypothetical protein|nr:hypothetical protein [Blastocatellia bacterium]
MKLKRNRIVIDLDKARADQPGRARGRRSGRAGRIFGIIAVVLVLIIIGAAASGYFWWRNYQNSPAYSLALLADAAQRNDTAGVESIIDSDKVCDDFVAQVQQREGGSAVSAITSILPAQTTSAMQTVTPKLKQTVHDELMKEVQRLTEPAKGKPFLLVALAITSFADITETNKVAQVKVNIKDEHLQLTMQPSTADAKRWRITAVQDDKLTKLIADGVTRSLTSTGSEIKDAIHKQWDKIK